MPIQTFASLSPGELVPILGVLAAMLAAFYALVKYMLDKSEKDREADRQERIVLTQAIKDMADSNREIAAETKQGNIEAKERNGHLAELTIQGNDRVINTISHISQQLVDERIVRCEKIENRESLKKRG